jgi:hypothetical protein
MKERRFFMLAVSRRKEGLRMPRGAVFTAHNLKRFAWAFLGAALFWNAGAACAQFSLGGDSPIKLEADQVDFLRDQGVVVAKGHVHVQEDAVNIYAENMRFDMGSRQLTAEGTVTWQQDNQEVRCRQLSYNLNTKKGRAEEVETNTAPWYYRGEDVLLEPNVIRLHKARFSTCDYPVGYEHYHMSASTITVRPGKTMTATNVVLYMGKIPVFYLPYFAKNMKDFRMPFQFDTGSSDYLGRYALFTINYLFTPVDYGSLYVDYFQKKGVGLGIRHEIELSPYAVLSLYGYQVHEKDTKEERWEARVRSLWAFSSHLQGRIEVDAPGDGRFSQDYTAARRDASLVSTQRQYDVSTTCNSRYFNLGLLWRRMETASGATTLMNHFERSAQYSPQVDFSIYPKSFIGQMGPKLDFQSTVTRQWLVSNGYYQTMGSAGYGIAQSWSPARTQSLYGRVGLQETFLDKSDLGITDKGNSRLVNTTENLTSRWLPFLTTSFSHQYARKLIHLLDVDQPLHGVTTNLLNGSMDCNFSTAIVSRTSTSYDFLTPHLDSGKRFSYLSEEFTCTPSRLVDFLTVANYSMVAKELKDFSEVLSVKSAQDMWRCRLSLNYMDPNVTTQGVTMTGLVKTLDVTYDLSVVLFTNYRLSLLEDFNLVNASFVSRQISVYRDLHDWEAEFGYTQPASENKTIYFRLNLKAFPGRPLTISESEMKRFSGYKQDSMGVLGETAAQEFR